MSDSAVTRRLASGRWRAAHRGVLLVGGAEEPELLTRITAARLCAGGGHAPAGVPTGIGAARLLAFDDGASPFVPELILPRAVRRDQRAGVRLRWPLLLPTDVTVRHGIPCVTARRALADLSARLGYAEVLVLADAALRTGACQADELVAIAGPRPRGGRRALRVADARAESPFESRLRAELIQARVPPPVLQHVVRADGRFVARVDFAWPDIRLAVEADGAGVHASAAALQGDLRRQNAVLRAGWTMLRFTWADLGRIAPVVRAEIAARSR